jgi:hypothetical protein
MDGLRELKQKKLGAERERERERERESNILLSKPETTQKWTM